MIYNKYVFGKLSSSRHRVPKTFDISYEEMKGSLLFIARLFNHIWVNEMILENPKDEAWLPIWGSQFHSHLWGGSRCWRSELITNDHD